jgi:hypothetical protein
MMDSHSYDSKHVWSERDLWYARNRVAAECGDLSDGDARRLLAFLGVVKDQMHECGDLTLSRVVEEWRSGLQSMLSWRVLVEADAMDQVAQAMRESLEEGTDDA